MAAASGVQVQDQAVQMFTEMKLKKTYKLVMFKLTADLKEVEVEKTETDSTITWDNFTDMLPKEECRYAVFDYHYTISQDAGDRKQLVFVVWCPDGAKTKEKMLYASSKDAIKKKLLGINHELQANDMSDLSEEEVKAKVSKGYH